MKKIFSYWKCFAAVLVCLVTLNVSSEVVHAEELTDSEESVIDGSLLTTDTEAEDTQQIRLRNSYLFQGIVKITNNGNGIVGIGGSTDCIVDCDVVKLNLYLERSKGNSGFSSYKSFEYTAYNENSLMKGFSYAVEKGYYYRLRGYHYASKNGKAENLGSRTDGIYIG